MNNALDEDNLVVFVDTVLVDPVRVKAVGSVLAQIVSLVASSPSGHFSISTLPHCVAHTGQSRTRLPHDSDSNSHSQVSTPLADTLLGGRPESSLELQVVDTLSDGFTVGGTLRGWPLPVSSSNSNSVDEVALLGLVPQSPGLVRSGRARSSVDDGELSVLPASNSGDELEDVRLLLRVELRKVLVSSHFAGF